MWLVQVKALTTILNKYFFDHSLWAYQVNLHAININILVDLATSE